MKCRGCGAEITFIRTPSGKNMPCDFEEVPYWLSEYSRVNKDVVVLENGTIRRCRLTGQGRPAGYGRTPHWATCPAGDKFRSTKGEEL